MLWNERCQSQWSVGRRSWRGGMTESGRRARFQEASGIPPAHMRIAVVRRGPQRLVATPYVDRCRWSGQFFLATASKDALKDGMP